jgi:cell division septum initiation protein DivIVA
MQPELTTGPRSSIDRARARKECIVTAIAVDAAKLRELDEDVRKAWTAYHERLRELTGEEYALAEDESWLELQEQLGELDERRRRLTDETS